MALVAQSRLNWEAPSIEIPARNAAILLCTWLIRFLKLGFYGKPRSEIVCPTTLSRRRVAYSEGRPWVLEMSPALTIRDRMATRLET